MPTCRARSSRKSLGRLARPVSPFQQPLCRLGVRCSGSSHDCARVDRRRAPKQRLRLAGCLARSAGADECAALLSFPTDRSARQLTTDEKEFWPDDGDTPTYRDSLSSLQRCAAARPVPLVTVVTSPRAGESESVQVPARPGAGRPGAPGPSRAAFRLTISGRPSVAVRVTGTVRGPPGVTVAP